MTGDGPAEISALPRRIPGFLSLDECRDLIAEVDAGDHEQVQVWTGSDFGVHADSRRGVVATLSADTEIRVQDRLWDVVPELERGFGCEVSHVSAITALIYGRGDHFAAHCDGGDDGGPPEVCRRRVSLVVTLNDGARDFEGGELHFYPGCTPEGAPGAEQIVPVRSEPGLLIAFPSPLTHRVTPVLDGCRYSLALWALAPA